mgnify:CR=1 FL=1
MDNLHLKEYISIGEMAKLSKVSTKTLRYYDRIELLIPSYIDIETNYRYYTEKDLILLNAIKKLKFQGFSLSEIKELLTDFSLQDFINQYSSKIESINNEIQGLIKKKERMTIRRKLLNNAQNILRHKKHEIDIEINTFQIKKAYCISKKNINFSLSGMLEICNELLQVAEKQNLDILEPFFVIVKTQLKDFTLHDCDIDFCVYINSDKENNFTHNKEIESGEYVEFNFIGPNFSRIKSNVLNWIEKNNVKISGYPIFNFIYGIEHARDINNIVIKALIKVNK